MLASNVSSEVMKSFADWEMVDQTLALKLKVPFFIAAIMSASEEPLNGGIPERIM